MQRCRRTDMIIENRLVRNDARSVIDQVGPSYDFYQASLRLAVVGQGNPQRLLLSRRGREGPCCNREA